MLVGKGKYEEGGDDGMKMGKDTECLLPRKAQVAVWKLHSQRTALFAFPNTLTLAGMESLVLLSLDPVQRQSEQTYSHVSHVEAGLRDVKCE